MFNVIFSEPSGGSENLTFVHSGHVSLTAQSLKLEGGDEGEKVFELSEGHWWPVDDRKVGYAKVEIRKVY